MTAIIALPRHPKGARALRLPFAAPFAVDPLWRQKQLIGWFLDRFVGFFWCIVMLAGFNRNLKCVPLPPRSSPGQSADCRVSRLGVTNLAGAAIAAWYYRLLL